jgi:ferredoxin-NADP reductase
MSVTLKHDGKEITHYFSFSSSPSEKEYIEFTKRLSLSDYSTALRNMKVGDWAKIEGPNGNFTFEGEHPKVVLLAGGIGITPFFSICKNATDVGLASKIILFYASRTPNDIPFKKEIMELNRKNPNLKVILTVNEPTQGWTGRTGNIDAYMIIKEVPGYSEYIFYACGPPPMVKAMQTIIQSIGISKDRLKIEQISGYS